MWSSASKSSSLALALVVLAACASTGEDWTAPSAEREELTVYQTTARFVLENYYPSERSGEIGAVCLVVGRREAVARRQKERESRPDWDPSGALLRALSDFRTPVVPISQCAWDSDLVETHVPTGQHAMVLGMSQPRWSSADFATVRVSTRESSLYNGNWRCNLRKRWDEWELIDCL